MGREEEIIKERSKKINELRKKGINPYPYKFDKKNNISECLKKKLGTKVKTAGRLIIKREIGRITFAKIIDSTGKIQIVLQENKTLKKDIDFFKKYVDIGDFIGIEGKIFKTKTKEISILIEKLQVLSKSILPLPEKWHGLQDKEERYRKRYLDLIMNSQIKEVFIKRQKIIDAIREFLIKRNYVEVDTPILQPIPGGAIAKPFVTHYNVYDKDVFLRIAPEIYLKKLLIGGFEKVFEFARCFRNEGVDWSHNPEFTNLEFYQAYIDYEELMKITEELIIEVVKKVNGKAEMERNGKKIKIKIPFKKITFEKLTKGKMNDETFKEEVKKIIQPTFIINYPLDISPLAKRDEKKEKGKIVQRFQLIIDGIEIVNAFSELNDPLEQEQ